MIRSGGLPERGDPRAGFTLIESMVALAVAAVFLVALGRVFASAWSAAPRSAEMLSAVTLARAVAARSSEAVAGAGEAGAYRYARSTGSVELIERPSGLAPAPAVAAPPKPPAQAQPGQNAAILRGLTPLAATVSGPSADAVQANPILAGLTPLGQDPSRNAAPVRPLRLRRLTVTVTMPSRRRLVWQSIGLDDAAR